MIKIKKSYLSRLQINCVSLFDKEDDDTAQGKGGIEHAIQHWLEKITDNERDQHIIYDIVNRYKFDTDWERTYKALTEAGYEVEGYWNI